MVKYFFYVVLLFVSATTTHCTKTSTTPDDSNSLPPETQTGVGTFACKINGVVWKYKDPNYEFLSTKPVTRWEFDPTIMGGNLYIGGFRYSDGITANSLLAVGADSLLFVNEKNINNNGYNFGIVFNNFKPLTGECYEYRTTNSIDSSKNFFSSGKLIITKLIQSSKIISGTFYCTIKQTGCDTLKITDGRFDLKYQ